MKIIILMQILFIEPDCGISNKTRILDEPICKNANKMDIAFLTLTLLIDFITVPKKSRIWDFYHKKPV